ncbi:toluene transporter [Komagataeibacter nataicola]|uniref:Toluene transporter n=1 Tax=Komagataeibacter nataicola TaxID=265960 RepID=A0A9N7CH26_9PROT|nr:ABC transporter substrate-binding protein [Komagataeibacter nataicola]AQU87335.1 toluene transporter [Komagataeibacter nataicola]PYD65786.1 toluene transporter [Komagataeibacter nataicola]WEQ55714.1 ABC transporter substrate-binding protein [Komagataeibacter nataicola]WNM09359.1 ABC transporter substrate-binding protein [Komagataeibacter nataicola]GBR21671.1 toluene transporter auxiliary component Ttg1D [Komagataeibacter nataicola NRIC 0616]
MNIMKHALKTTALALCAGLMAAPVIPAVFPIHAAHAASASDAQVQEPIKALYAALDRVQAKGSGTFEQRSQMLAPSIDRAYDMETVLASSIGPRYAALPADQKQQLLATFRQFTIARYVSSFKPGSDARFTIDPAVTPSPVGNDRIVITHIGSSDDPSGTEINYVMRSDAKGWQIVDVLLNAHISQVAAQRADFSSALSGGNVQKLTNLLQKKIKTFSEE